MDKSHWNIGKISITPIIEIEEGGDIIQSITPDATKENVLKISWLQPYFADEQGNLKAVVQAFIVNTEESVILVDACIGNDKVRVDFGTRSRMHTDFMQRIRETGYRPKDIDMVVCTHLHFDHVGWITTLKSRKWTPTFPNSRYLFSKTEFDYWKNKPKNEMDDDHAGFEDSVMPVYEASLVELVKNNHKITEGVRLLSTPGHTPGHVSVIIESGKEKAVITGDVFHHPCQIARPDWMSFDSMPEQALSSRLKFLKHFANTDTLIIGSHFAPPTAGRIISKDNSFVFHILL